MNRETFYFDDIYDKNFGHGFLDNVAWRKAGSLYHTLKPTMYF